MPVEEHPLRRPLVQPPVVQPRRRREPRQRHLPRERPRQPLPRRREPRSRRRLVRPQQREARIIQVPVALDTGADRPGVADPPHVRVQAHQHLAPRLRPRDPVVVAAPRRAHLHRHEPRRLQQRRDLQRQPPREVLLLLAEAGGVAPVPRRPVARVEVQPDRAPLRRGQRQGAGRDIGEPRGRRRRRDLLRRDLLRHRRLRQIRHRTAGQQDQREPAFLGNAGEHLILSKGQKGNFLSLRPLGEKVARRAG